MVEYAAFRGNSTIFSYTPGNDEALTAQMTPGAMRCGVTPTFDRWNTVSVW